MNMLQMTKEQYREKLKQSKLKKQIGTLKVFCYCVTAAVAISAVFILSLIVINALYY